MRLSTSCHRSRSRLEDHRDGLRERTATSRHLPSIAPMANSSRRTAVKAEDCGVKIPLAGAPRASVPRGGSACGMWLACGVGPVQALTRPRHPIHWGRDFCWLQKQGIFGMFGLQMGIGDTQADRKTPCRKGVEGQKVGGQQLKLQTVRLRIRSRDGPSRSPLEAKTLSTPFEMNNFQRRLLRFNPPVQPSKAESLSAS